MCHALQQKNMTDILRTERSFGAWPGASPFTAS
jgi:hypothetical protein